MVWRASVRAEAATSNSQGSSNPECRRLLLDRREPVHGPYAHREPGGMPQAIEYDTAAPSSTKANYDVHVPVVT